MEKLTGEQQFNIDHKESETVFEIARLRETVAIAAAQLAQAQETAGCKKEALLEAKKEVRENGTHGTTNLYGANDFEALVELSQYMSPVTAIIEDYEEEQRKISRLEKMMKNPYFARIDFLFEDEDETEKIYIGRSTLMEKDSLDMYVYDWRSPIASVFYRFMTGRAFYDAPDGEIEGEVTLKRQFEIDNGTLQYFFDTDRNISDAFLRQMLSRNASPQMKAIVETIQKEQDVAIRDMKNDLLMVQGVAGSGKTSIALHRTAYLMYQGLQSKLSAENILIVSPNSAFERYISNVLPELGEENVESIVFEDMLRKLLRKNRIQSKNDFLEHAVTNGRYKDVVKQSMAFKTSEKFRDILDRFIADIPYRWLELKDIYHEGIRAVNKEKMREWLLRRPEVPIGRKMEQLDMYVLESVFGTVKKRRDAEARERIQREVQQFNRLNVPALYKKLFDDEDYKTMAVQAAGDADMIDKIWNYTRENLDSGFLYYDDAIAAAYLYLKTYGTNRYRNIKQIVIDEAQDYYPLQFDIFRQLFPNAKFTVLGDINQTLAKQEDLSFYEKIRKILNKNKSSLITLDKSFRCTNEILTFGLQFMERRPEIQSFNRSGEQPEIAAAATHKELLERLVQEVKLCEEKGYQTICLITKTEKETRRLYEELKSLISLQLIKGRSMESLQGIFIMPVYMSKGLEFDAVVLCDVNAQNYYDEDDRKLLYVECTRALHRLSVFCEGTMSALITEN